MCELEAILVLKFSLAKQLAKVQHVMQQIVIVTMEPCIRKKTTLKYQYDMEM